ncbi:AMP-binding protein [Pelagibacterales bacterium SAG-MED17]|nr:AMP-binding protein [Pelagibacterales bacterium SAG-MED17]
MSKRIVRNIFENVKDENIALTSEISSKLSYKDLKLFINKISKQLAGNGLSNKDRAAIVLPNGPYMASSFLAISSYMSAAPLNPSYKSEEYEFYLKDLNPKIVLVEKNSDNPVVDVAKKLKIELCEINPEKDGPSGIFNIYENETEYSLPDENDESLVLHTSGTTSRPKIVPLTNKNIFSSAENISKSLNLSENDHCLNIMPLFHIHGLIAILASSMKAGASVCASNGFNAIKFLDLAKSEKINWYSGVPTMHQTILLRARRNSEIAKELKLRLIRSSSASLPPAVFKDLNDVFNCPVIEAYGMTEATHQMTSNPLPPKQQKAGFVGLPAGPEVCIMSENGGVLKQGEEGEVCIKGENVTLGYDNNEEANKTSFTNGWFRTGDQGYFDKEGYLKISGRLKEIINKGGEKISPLEVDNVLMDHPFIDQAVCFGYDDKMLGENIASAIIIKSGVTCSENDILEYAQKKLAKFKIPKKIFFVEEIPKGATGKLQRNVLAKKFGLNN